MATRKELVARIAHLESRVASGVRSVRDHNGEQVDYASDREQAAALAAARHQLEALDRPPVRTIRFHMTKGL